jgi:hypothetical protein
LKFESNKIALWELDNKIKMNLLWWQLYHDATD